MGSPARAGAALLLVFVAMALLAGVVAPYGYQQMDLRERLSPPSLEAPRPGRPPHLLGTDNLGRDTFSRVVYGSRISLAVGFLAVGISLVGGVLLGLAAGWLGRWWDSGIMRLMDLMLAFPTILLAIVIVAVLGNSLANAMLAVGVVGIPVFARLTRATVLSVKEMDYVQAAVASGAGDLRIVLRHVLPNCLNPLIVQATLSVGTAVLDAAGLSFLGLGAKPPQPEWGTMLADTYRYFAKAPWLVICPGLAIMGLVLGFNLLGDGLRDVLDPRSRRR